MQLSDIILADDEQVELQTSEKTLFLTVILQALLDATKPRYDGEPTNSILERERAIAWFFASVGTTAEDFEEVCTNAGVDPDYMRDFAVKVLKTGEIEYVRRRINAILGH